VYQDYRQNFVVDLGLLEAVKTLKVESWRLGNERSEDALSWNVFVGLAGLGGLNEALRLLTGYEGDKEPELYLWGVRIDVSAPQRWTNLARVRGELEAGAGLPTEPDVILHVPGELLVLIEAKFGSPNGTFKGKDERFGSIAEYLDSYPGLPGQADPLDREWIEGQPAEAILEQLCRNIVFAHWLAQSDERPMVVNVVRNRDESDVSQRISQHLAKDIPVQFRRATWESLARMPLMATEAAEPLRTYLGNKSNGLTNSFDL
jgi:hypothetical protein